jgi:hypothetical protein
MSFFTCELKSSGVLAIRSKPSVLMRSLTPALARMAMILPWSLFTIKKSISSRGLCHVCQVTQAVTQAERDTDRADKPVGRADVVVAESSAM